MFGERQCRVKYETEIFGRQAGHWFGGREGERGVDYFKGLLRDPIRRNSVLEGLRVR